MLMKELRLSDTSAILRRVVIWTSSPKSAQMGLIEEQETCWAMVFEAEVAVGALIHSMVCCICGGVQGLAGKLPMQLLDTLSKFSKLTERQRGPERHRCQQVPHQLGQPWHHAGHVRGFKLGNSLQVLVNILHQTLDFFVESLAILFSLLNWSDPVQRRCIKQAFPLSLSHSLSCSSSFSRSSSYLSLAIGHKPRLKQRDTSQHRPSMSGDLRGTSFIKKQTVQ